MRSGDEPVILIYDGHGSHVASQLRKIAFENNVHLYKLPPHTTHRLQPLDVGIFGPIQRSWQEQCEAALEEDIAGLHISQAVKAYMIARQAGMCPEIITKAWKKSGLNPINPDLFTDDDYSPSKSSSTCPQHPRNPFAESSDSSSSEDNDNDSGSDAASSDSDEDLDDETKRRRQRRKAVIMMSVPSIAELARLPTAGRIKGLESNILLYQEREEAHRYQSEYQNATIVQLERENR